MCHRSVNKSLQLSASGILVWYTHVPGFILRKVGISETKGSIFKQDSFKTNQFIALTF